MIVWIVAFGPFRSPLVALYREHPGTSTSIAFEVPAHGRVQCLKTMPCTPGISLSDRHLLLPIFAIARPD